VSERHIRWLFVVLLVGQLLLLTAQARQPGGERSYLEAGLVRTLGPVASLVATIGDAVQGVGGSIRLNRALSEENRQLRAEVEELRQESMRHFGMDTDLQRLSEALAYERSTGGPVQSADIVYIDHTSWLQTAIVVVPKGSVEVNQPVVSSDGLVGRVVLVSGRYAKVQLVTDRSASVGAMIERNRRQGVVRGGGRGTLELDYIPLQTQVNVGDEVVTAGIDGVFPRGVPVGTITEVVAGSELFHRIRVVPSVDFGLLDQVFVLGREALPEEIKGDLPDARP